LSAFSFAPAVSATKNGFARLSVLIPILIFSCARSKWLFWLLNYRCTTINSRDPAQFSQFGQIVPDRYLRNLELLTEKPGTGPFFSLQVVQDL
jgi:hypothetical protein